MPNIFLRLILILPVILSVSASYSQNVAPFDILINEIMADHNPLVGLPAFEWIEIYNTSSETINLENFGLSSGSSPKLLPNFEIAPGGYILITDDSNELELSSFGNVAGLGSFPSLTNNGDIVTLTDNNGIIIHEVIYDISWYGDDTKDNGGYSLELINPEDPCLLKYNWMASLDAKGGTPGEVNSVFLPNSDVYGPRLVSAVPISEDQISIHFNKSISSSVNEMQFSLMPGLDIVDLNFGSTPDHITLTTSHELETGTVYQIQIQPGIEDCLGITNSDFQTLEFGIPEYPEPGDIIINEILFNPKTDGSDFVEILNTTDKYLDLNQLSIGNLDENGIGTIKDIDRRIILQPLNYLVFTEDISDIETKYPRSIRDRILEVDMPSFNNTDGNVTLLVGLNNMISILDEVDYNEGMHNPFIDDFNGISLERVSAAIASSISDNWQSASAGSGFGTPTFQNSQKANAIELGNNRVELRSKTFTPNGDSQNDILEVIFELDKSDYLATIDVFDGYGRFVDQIASNQLLGRSDMIIWDGYASEQKLAQAGIYIIFVKLLRSDGFVYKKKLPCVLSTKL